MIHAYASPAFNYFNQIIAEPAIDVDIFELKPVRFHMLQTVGQFHGLAYDNPNLHLRYFLEVSDSFKIQGVEKH